jgi:two-component system, chemotaxis family, sensor histidine kinase and response regulator PixL
MDNDRQIPLKFLDEAEDCYDRIESTVLGLANKIADPQALDHALRAAHSVKGGAAMMGFTVLSHIAHQLEDFFKILRVRHHSKSIETKVETLLLKGVDCLRQVNDLYRQGHVVSEDWLSTNSQSIFDELHQHLGDLRAEDEDALLSQEGDVDPGILLFESGVEEALNHLESQLDKLSSAQLLQELAATADELCEFGRMAKLDRFIELCSVVKIQIEGTDRSQSVPLAHQALKVWRRSHAVVLLGRFEKIPTQLSGLPITRSATAFASDVETFDEEFPEESFNPDLLGMEDLISEDSIDLSLLQSELANMDVFGDGEEEFTAVNGILLPAELVGEPAALGIAELTMASIPNWDDHELQADATDSLFLNQPSLELLSALESVEMPELSLMEGDQKQFITVDTSLQEIVPIASSTTPAQIEVAANHQTVRIPVKYLEQFNNVFGKLILERNAINLRLEEIHGYAGLLRKRMQHLELSNKELRQWYDRASTEGLVPATEETRFPADSLTHPPILTERTSSPAVFDLLEMDRYSDLHLVSQDQMETIVQLQEVTTDIELSLREMTQSVRSLNQTTRMLQSNVTRTQMLPFADVVSRFPRLIRDLSVQFGKPVTLKILGENTGIDRAMLDRLSDPLIHLLRNAFDHGIEDPATRLAAGKPEQGVIVLEASQRGGETVITISDDGGGIKLDRIRDRLQQIGLPIETLSEMTESELLDTIFEPGFSTATSLTELSGRGVGMDIVRTNIEQIKGSIRVKTQPGVGTTFVIRVPFSLSIVRVMLLERENFVFAVAIDSIKEIIGQPNLLTADGKNISWQSQIIPLVALEQGISFQRIRRPMELSGVPTIDKPTILIVGEDQLLTSFYIDRYWGEQEVTRCPIDSLMPLTPGFGSSIILGDGRVVPLIDLPQLASWMLSSTDRSLGGVSSGSISAKGLLPVMAERTQPDTILVIDDSINVRRYLAAMLEKEGYQVEQAKDGQEAVEKLCGGLVVQAAICDVEMPRLDGYGVLEALRSNEDFERLPILMLTSRSSAKHRLLAMNLGASAYFSKPYIETELLETLSSLIKMSNAITDSHYANDQWTASLAVSAPQK